MRRISLVATLLSALALPSITYPQAPTLPPADSVLTQAKSSALAQHKNILLTFSASWCGPCHLFEAFEKDPAIRPLLDRAFVLISLDTMERPTDKRHADNPGAPALLKSFGGGDSVPFIIMLSPTGVPIVTSLRPDSKGPANIGYPDASYEIDWFIDMLRKAAPTLTPTELATIKRWLDAHSTSRPS